MRRFAPVLITLILLTTLALVRSALAVDDTYLDSTFSTDGMVVYPDANYVEEFGNPLALQPDGKILVVTADWPDPATLRRLNPDGSPDTSFGTSGVVTLSADLLTDLYIQPDGKIITTGNAVERWNADGSPDASFSSFVLPSDFAPLYAVTTADSSIILVGSDGPMMANSDDAKTIVARYSATGILDTSFGDNGKQIVDLGYWEWPMDVLIDEEDGLILIVSALTETNPDFNADAYIVSLTSEGELDTDFNATGSVVIDLNMNDVPMSAAFQSDGKIIITGFSEASDPGGQPFNARINPDGTLDTSYAGTGILYPALPAEAYFMGLALQPDDSLVVTGMDWSDTAPQRQILVARFTPDGDLDTSFGAAGTILPPADDTYAASGLGVAVDAAGRVVVLGATPDDAQPGIHYGTIVLRYLPQGAPDAPGDLTATAASTRQIDLAWTDNATDETGYRVEWSNNGTDWFEIATLGADTETYSHTNLGCSTMYQYRVRAYRSGDNTYSAYSDSAEATAACDPLQPAGVTLFGMRTLDNVCAGGDAWDVIDISGAEMTFYGGMFSNGDIDLNGGGIPSYVYGGTTMVGTLSDSGAFVYDPAPVEGAPVMADDAYAPTFPLSAFQPGGKYELAASADTCAADTLDPDGDCYHPMTWPSFGSVTGQVFEGLYYITGDFKATGTLVVGPKGATFISPDGVLKFPSMGGNIWPYEQADWMFAATYKDDVCSEVIDGPNSAAKWNGHIYAPRGECSFSIASGSTVYGTMACQKIDLSGSQFELMPPSMAGAANLNADAVSTTQINLTWQDNASGEANYILEYSFDESNWTSVVLPADTTSYQHTDLACNWQVYYRLRADYGGSLYSGYVYAGTTTDACDLELPAGATLFGARTLDTALTCGGGTANYSIDFSGSNAEIYGGIHSNANIDLNGSGYTSTVFDWTTAVGVIDSAGFDFIPGYEEGVAPRMMPNHWLRSDFAPGGQYAAAALADTCDEDEDSSDGGSCYHNLTAAQAASQTSFEGLYYITGDMTGGDQLEILSIGNKGATFILANGMVKFAKIDAPLTPYENADFLTVASYSNNVCDVVIDGPANKPAWDGYLYAPKGECAFSVADGDTVYGGAICQQVNLTGSNFTMRPPLGPLDAPTSLSADAVSQTQIDLDWNDNAFEETAYLVERSTDQTTWDEIATLDPDSESYSDTGLTCGTTYYYQVRAYRADDSAYTEYSNIASATTDLCPLAAPMNLNATLEEHSTAALTWDENAADETSVKLERSSDLTTWTVISLAANAESYDDTSLACGTSYTYRVRVHRSADNAYSTYSNTAQITTDPCSLIPNGSFEDNDDPTPLVPDGWTAKKLQLSTVDGLDATTFTDGARSFRIKGNGTGKKLIQLISVPGTAGSYTLSFDALGDNVGGSGNFMVKVKVFLPSGDKKNFKIKVTDTGDFGWMGFTKTFSFPAYTKLEVTIQYTRTLGTVWLDDLRLIKN
jgi:uncharacterized delta-60 repeat protein